MNIQHHKTNRFSQFFPKAFAEGPLYCLFVTDHHFIFSSKNKTLSLSLYLSLSLSWTRPKKVVFEIRPKIVDGKKYGSLHIGLFKPYVWWWFGNIKWCRASGDVCLMMVSQHQLFYVILKASNWAPLSHILVFASSLVALCSALWWPKNFDPSQPKRSFLILKNDIIYVFEVGEILGCLG